MYKSDLHLFQKTTFYVLNRPLLLNRNDKFTFIEVHGEGEPTLVDTVGITNPGQRSECVKERTERSVRAGSN